MDSATQESDFITISEKPKPVNGHQEEEDNNLDDLTNGDAEKPSKVNGEVLGSDKSCDDEALSTNGDAASDKDVNEENSETTECEKTIETQKDDKTEVHTECKSDEKTGSEKDNDSNAPGEDENSVHSEKENDDEKEDEESKKCDEKKSSKAMDDEVQIVKENEESDVEMLDEDSKESIDDIKSKQDKDTIAMLESNDVTVKSAGRSAKTSVSSSAQTANITQLQTALQAISSGGGGAMQGLQNAYLHAIQQVLLAQGSSSGNNQQYLSQLQQYYNSGGTSDEAYVIEAPSFIVPYVMEGKPQDAIADYVKRIEKEAQEQKKNEKESKKLEEKEQKKEAKETEKSDVPEEKSEQKSHDEELDKDDAEYKVKENDDDSSSSDSDIDDDIIDLDKDEIVVPEDYSHLGRWEPYYRSTLGKFVLELGLSQCQEFIQQDLYKMQKRKLDKMKTNPTKGDVNALKILDQQLAKTKKKNSHLAIDLKMCKFCSFKTESETVMSRHLESPHMSNYTYKCNFCLFETRGPQVILFHMEAEHTVRGRLERASAFFQCPLCPYEDNNKSKMTRHSFSCSKRFKPDRNCELLDWEPPAKIPKMQKSRGGLGSRMDASKIPNLFQKSFGNSALQANLSGALMGAASASYRGRGRPVGSYKNITPVSKSNPIFYRPPGAAASILQQIPGVTSAQLSVASQVLQSVGQGLIPQFTTPTPNVLRGVSGASSVTIQSVNSKGGTVKSPQTPSISITPLPRGQVSKTTSKDGSKPTFVICEICDGYIKDLEQLRNHMNLIHHVKIHPKMIYNRPPLNCQKCQHRFFTDQGLERHLLGNHGLVTSSMQEASNKGKDAGRCPICGKVFQWKLLNHVSRDHKMTLKPAHLSYKCTVCTATFNMYRLFENHVYSAHSVVNKNKNSSGESSSSSKKISVSDGPLKINDEITIIPQPASKGKSDTSKKTDSPAMSKEITITKVGSRPAKRPASDSVEIINLDESPRKTEHESKRPQRNAKKVKLQ